MSKIINKRKSNNKSKNSLFTLALILFLLVACAFPAFSADGPSAHWDFDEGSGSYLRDKSGNGNDGSIHGARWVKEKTGYALSFDGVDDSVEVPDSPALSVSGPVTFEAWIKPASVPSNEPGIVGKTTDFSEGCGLTYFADGFGYFYLSNGGNHCKAPVAAEMWHHLAGTFDGKTLRLYINGKLKASRNSNETKTDGAGSLYIGFTRGSYFQGLIDEVKVYDRTLSDKEVEKSYASQAALRYEPAMNASRKVLHSLKGAGLEVTIGNKGDLEVITGKDSYFFESSFSYPAERMGRNYLSRQKRVSEVSWKPSVKLAAKDRIEILAKGRYYSLTRVLQLEDGRLKVRDTLTNTSPEPVGIMVEHNISCNDAFSDTMLGGSDTTGISMTAENPTIFLNQKASSLGVIAEDDILRLQFEGTSNPNLAKFSARHFALRPGKSYTMKWAVYPFPKRADYFDFVNRVRKDWKSNFTLNGPMGFFESDDPMLDDLPRLKAHLKKMRLRIIALRPFHAYWIGAELTQDQYRDQIRRAVSILKQADPTVKVIGCIENNIVSYSRADLPDGKIFDDVSLESGRYPVALSEQQTRMAELSPWADSLVKNAEGRAMIEDCAPRTYIHPMVYSKPGNYQAKHLMDQMRFMIEDVSLDGVYIDQFNMAFEPKQRYHYSEWDGHTVDIDPSTGRITTSYTDSALVGAPVRKALIDYVLSKGKVFVANTHAAVEETQPLHAFRFMEAGWSSKEVTWKEGEEPALITYLSKGHFDSPIGLGVSSLQISPAERDRYSEIIMRSVITLLRHALLYYYYSSDMPESGPGSGEYGPIIHMFPITPTELHKGWIKGRERIVTAVSVDTLWEKAGEPKVLFFDIKGRETDAAGRYTVKKEKGLWRVRLNLRDWQEIAVVE